jgi:hypothetical protein
MPKSHIVSRYRRSIFAALLGLAVTSAYAAQFDLSALRPSGLFMQAGVGDQSTRAYVAGATWDWKWRRQISFLAASGYFEADIGRWTTDDLGVSSSTWATQFGLTPVIRLQPSGADHWFAEIGVGANYILPLYRTSHKRFSTEFNFADPLALGVNVVNTVSTNLSRGCSTSRTRGSSTPIRGRTSCSFDIHGDFDQETQCPTNETTGP